MTDRGELVLRERSDGHLELRANGLFVMDTREHRSERALATQALARAPAGPARVLIGGLGLGFTLAAALADDRVVQCTVAELEPDLVTWMRDGTVPHGPPLLDDPRTDVLVADIADVLGSAEPAAYELVLLDVDNGPGNLVHAHNARLYRDGGLVAVRRALSRDGVVVVWSAAEDPALEAALQRVFGTAEQTSYDVPGNDRAGRYHLYAARNPAG